MIYIVHVVFVILGVEEFIRQTLTAERALLMHNIDALHLRDESDVIEVSQIRGVVIAYVTVERRLPRMLAILCSTKTCALGSVPIIQHVPDGLLRTGRPTNVFAHVIVFSALFFHCVPVLILRPCIDNRDGRARVHAYLAMAAAR